MTDSRDDIFPQRRRMETWADTELSEGSFNREVHIELRVVGSYYAVDNLFIFSSFFLCKTPQKTQAPLFCIYATR